MKRKDTIPVVFFNASVILSGIRSSSGASAKLLRFAKQKRITGLISEIILDETLRHADKIGFSSSAISTVVTRIFVPIYPPPNNIAVRTYTAQVIDSGDAHVLASSRELDADYLVTLDKRHLLVLQDTIKWIKIVSPKELIEQLG